MIRVAQVKFGRHSKTYDYICEDRSIKEEYLHTYQKNVKRLDVSFFILAKIW